MNEQQSKSVDFTIVGAGIAGLSMADELLQRNKSVTIIDSSRPGSGSSGAPLVLINPATGRRAKMVQDPEKSLGSVVDLLSRVKDYSKSSFYKKNGVLRPALDKELAKDFRRSPDKYDWPDCSWIKWLDEDAFSSAYNYFGDHCGGLIINNGYTVNTPVYLNHLTDYLISNGLTARFNTEAKISEIEP